ncbi:PREDICTED: glyoxylate reductase/hydroxypyruvate reductase-like [Priapulus caudatus]|uniref:Glyoxylate reductase/hydroxypyruvate reductase-like n=1 Tax=Priapulus caudatus TaxID=37621 RepID=A0ABM1DTX8_PRICU|nr:PREDICTED: glyoxylate reductase/hydroxypyruvate reductase-like [Priapulus caudatus]
MESKTANLIKPTVFVTGTVPRIGVELLEAGGCTVSQWSSDVVIPRQEFLGRVKGIDALFCKLTEKIDAELLDAAGPQLRVIGTMSVGYEHIDLKEIKNRKIVLGYTPDVLTDATAELTVAILLASARRILEAAHEVKSGGWGSWQPLWMCGKGLKESTVGVVGAGRIGQGVIDRLKPFKVSKFLYCNRNRNSEVEAKGPSTCH